MMGSRNTMIQTAKNHKGKKYSYFTNKFGCGLTAWCAIFMWVCTQESGNPDIVTKSASCWDQVNDFKRRGLWRGKTHVIRPGFWVYFDFDHAIEPRPTDHVGLVIEAGRNYIRTIEGNSGSGSNNETQVRENYYVLDQIWNDIYGFADPAYGDADPEKEQITERNTFDMELRILKRGDTGKNVCALQQLLEANDYSVGSCGCDGDIGTDTENAIKRFQHDRNLESDGICGPKTWAALLE